MVSLSGGNMLDEINAVLDVVSRDLRGAELVAAYDDALFEEDMMIMYTYLDQSSDNDAIAYGELV